VLVLGGGLVMAAEQGVVRRKKPSSARARALRATPAAEPTPGEFIPMEKWDGPRVGMIYKCGTWGPGYYLTAAQQRSNRSNTTDSGEERGSTASDGVPANRFRASAVRGRGAAAGCGTGASGLPTDLPEDAARALGRRLDRNGVTRELAVPLGGGWMQRGGRGSFEMGVDSGSGPCVELSSAEALFYLLTLDQNPDAHVVQTAHYRLEATFRCPAGLQAGPNVQHVAIVLDWRRTRSTVTAPCFTGIVLSGTCWRLEQYADGQKRTLGEVHDAGLKAGTASALSMAAPWQRVVIEVRGDRVHVTCNKRLLFGSFTIPPHTDTSLAGCRASRAMFMSGPVGIATYKTRVQIKAFEFTPLEGGGGGGSAAGAAGELRTPRPPFTGGEPKLVELIEGEMLEASPQVSWDTIGGLDGAKRLLNEAVVLPLLIPDYFAAAACRSTWKGVLLFGPPGTGKTLLAKAVASLGKTAFFNISASSLVSHYHGESEKLVRTLFAVARHHAPSVIFFDEVDALVSSRGMAGEHEASRRLKSELLMQMDGVHSHLSAASSAKENLVMVLATSNKPWDLDEAMRRRLERRIYVPLPDEASRAEMLQIHLKGVTLAADVDTAELAAATAGYPGADLALVCRDASSLRSPTLQPPHMRRANAFTRSQRAVAVLRAVMPMRRAVEGKTPQEIVELHTEGALEAAVSADDFRRALQHTRPSVTQEECAAYLSWNRKYGVNGAAAATGPNLAPASATLARRSASVASCARPMPLAPSDEQEAEHAGEVLISEVC
jgi:katanin p60 ATPase-containing subunit A1